MNELFAHSDKLVSVPEVSINWLAIFIATAVAMGIGFLWYGPVYGEKWMKLVGLKKKDAEKNWQTPMAVMLIMAFIQAYILHHFIVYSSYFYPDLSGLVIGLITGFWAFVGFALPLALSSNMFARRPNELTKIEVGNQLVTFLAIGAILGAFL
jgi:hypothetical protein